jgi:hypothetical protein
MALTPTDAALRALVKATEGFLEARPGIEQRHALAVLERCIAEAKARLAVEPSHDA